MSDLVTMNAGLSAFIRAGDEILFKVHFELWHRVINDMLVVYCPKIVTHTEPKMTFDKNEFILIVIAR